ncbi:CPBP family intramembrane glutamic endopeptidase [Mucilaginibacter auburnensis]|uniref:CAAX prenyl protease-like protein n=1 Tax=Mucilaginibacter auburnensis TaxID=1457233 RepID=A0A2H9VNJ4_9SPHI|nr:CPBP family intramembrane glutamic endopeptidase [Mucilaginibacter auburnensis]PJJ79882.1 CAAX prenyl protease-like protein [Mucilaginibacter auburnensis]
MYKIIFIGIAIGVASLIILAFVLYMMVPYRFVYQPINVAYVLEESYSFLLGAVLEELMFRGFLLVVFARLLGWRIGLLIMALPFGLYHIAGGLSMIVSTTLFSFVFGLSFVLTRSLWAAIFAHATANILLHLITGLDGGSNSVYKLVLDGNWPVNYAVGLLTSVISALVTSVVLYVIILGKRHFNNSEIEHPKRRSPLEHRKKQILAKNPK